MSKPISQEEEGSASQSAPNFSYTYSAQQRKEIERIRAKYIPPEEDRMARLRRLDKQAERQGAFVAICEGTISTLLLGIGMTLTMVFTRYFVLGIVVGVFGLAGIALAYPLYQHVTRKNRKKIAPDILRLSEELLSGRRGT